LQLSLNFFAIVKILMGEKVLNEGNGEGIANTQKPMMTNILTNFKKNHYVYNKRKQDTPGRR
jgi:hypothetical protein